MKRIVAVCAILAIMLVACAQPAMEKEAEPMQDMTEGGRQPPARPLPSERVTTPAEPETTTTTMPETATMPASAPVTTTSTAGGENDPEVKDLLKRADEKITSLRYLYGGSETGNLFLDTYDIKGSKMVLHRYEDDYYVREGYYDTVYIDMAAQSAVGCCIEQSRCKSHNVDNTGKRFDVDFSTLKIPKTPYQWAKEVKGAEVVGPQTFASRSVTFIKYTDANGAQVDLWVDDTYGVPHKVVVTSGGQEIKYQFNDLKFNTLKDADFEPAC